MKLSIEEFKQLVELLERPIKVEIDKMTNAITLRVVADESDILKNPIEISDTKIKKLGIYTIDDVKVWVVKK